VLQSYKEVSMSDNNETNENKKKISDMTADEIRQEQAKILLARGFTVDEINALIY